MEKYIRPFNTKEGLFKHATFRDLPEVERKYIRNMNDDKFQKCLDGATFGDCFDVGYFTYLIHLK